MPSLSLTRDAVRAELLSIARTVVDLDWDMNGDRTRFDEIGAESLDLLNITMCIERRFHISLAGISPHDLATTGDLLDIVWEAAKGHDT